MSGSYHLIRSALAKIAWLGGSRLLALLSFRAFLRRKTPRRPAKIADFGIVLPQVLRNKRGIPRVSRDSSRARGKNPLSALAAARASGTFE
jgi:hypothetical protein